MNKLTLLCTLFVPAWDNSNDALVPEMWAQEALMVLEKQLMMGALVYRDFSNTLASYGDTVNAHRPNTFTNQRKTGTDTVTYQDAQTTNVPVKLDQLGHVAFKIYDHEASLAFKDLVTLYLNPAIQAIAAGVEQSLIAQRYRFLSNAVVGKLGTSLTKTNMIAAQTKVKNLIWPSDGRHYALLTPDMAGQILDLEAMTDASKVGDAGTALRTGSIGAKFGINWLDSNANPLVESGSTTVTGAVKLTAGYAAGTTVLVVDGFTGALVTGSWCTIGGDMTPQLITAHTETAGDTTGITLSPGLRSAVVDDAVITVYSPGAVNLSAGYAAGWTKALTVNGFSVAPKIGQLASFGVTTSRYGVISSTDSPTTTKLTLDRNLYAAVANSDVIGLGPSGNFGFVFHPEAIALVTRPMAQPPANRGVESAIATYNNLSIRVTMQYDIDAQATKVVLDLLYGIEVLNSSLGFVLLG